MIDEQIPVDESTQVLAGSLFLAKDTTVDQASEALRLGKTLNLPADFVSRNLDWARKRAETSINVDALQVSHPKTAQLLSDPMNAAATKDDLERLMAIEDVLREGSAEPGLMSKDARNMVIRSLREQGYQIEEVPQVKGVFGRNLERTMKALSPQLPEIPEAPVQPSAVAAAPYMPPGARAAITEAPQVPEPSTVPQAKEVTQLPIQPAGFLDTVQRNVARGQFIPFVASGVELAEANALYDTVRRVGSGEGTAKDWLDLLKVDAEIRRGTTWGGMVGSGISQMPSFMGEMAATGGLATAGRKAAVNLGLAAAKRVLNKSARQVAMNLPLKSAIELGGWATKSALVGTVGNPVRVAANTLQRRIPALQNISENEFGDLEAFLKEPDESLAKSIFKAASQSSIEIGSEFSGGLLGKLGSKVAEATKLNAVKALVVGRWFKLHPTSGWSQFKERLKQVQFHGIIAEAGEEIVGDILTLLSQPLTDLETPDFNPEGYLAAAAAAAFVPGAGLLRYGPGMIAASNRLAQQAQAQVDFFRELGNEALQQKTRERVPGMLAMLGNMAAENGPVQSVFAPIEKWDAYFSARKMDPRAVAEQVLGSAEVYDRARQTGSDIEIPIGEYTEKLAPTEHNEVLSRDLRLGSSSAPTVNEMAEELRAQEAALDNLVKLNQSSEQLQARAATLEEQRVKLEADVVEAQARLPEIQTRLDAIRQQFPQTPAQALVATLTGQTESPEMQALANEYQSLTGEVEKANSLQSELDSVRSEQAQVATQLQEISAEDAKFQAAFPSKNPEVKAFTDEMTQQLLNTGRYGRDAVAKVHASIFARMMYILGARSGLSLQQMRERFPVTITGQEPASAELYQMDARDAEYMAAVEAGDMETAQRMVDEAAKAAGYGDEVMLTTLDAAKWSEQKQDMVRRIRIAKGNVEKANAALLNPEISPVVKKIAESSKNRNSKAAAELEKAVKLGPPPKKLFHGRASKWTVYSRKSNGRSIWGTDSSDVAATYGKDIAVLYFKMRNPLEINADGASFKEMFFEGEKLDADDLSAIAKNRGHDGLIIRNFYDSNDDSGGEILSDHFSVFDPSQIKSADPVTRDEQGNVIPLSQRFNPEKTSILYQAEDGKELVFPQENQGPRGSIAFAPSERGQERREFTIAMLAKANASTFMHEAAHWYLETVLDLVASPNATDSLKADAATIRRWLKMDDAQDYPTSEQHETFARGFEKYLMEGVAPAEDVRGFFASMRMWLIRIYKDLLNPELDATLSDDIRRVFDRMVATEDEIDAAQAENGVEPMFMEKPAFMTDDQWERYSKFVIKASMQAREKLQTRLMKEIRDAHTQERLDEKERIREEVSAELNADRNHIALAFLRFGKQPNGEEVNGIVAPFKLDRDSVIALPSVTKEVRKKLKNLGVYRVEGGMDADAAANILGFQSGDELVTALASTEPFAKAVSTETQRRLDVLYPSLVQDEQELADAAAEAVRNEQRDEVIAAEMSALARRVRADEQAVGRVAAGAPLGLLAKRLLRANEAQALAVSQLQDLRLINELARQSANRTLSAQQIREIRPSLYLAAAKRASAAAAKAVASGNFQQALAQKEAELVGHAMYRAAREIQKETEKMQRYLLRMSDDKALARLGKAGNQYREQVQAILERFQLRTTPLVRIEERLNLRKWIEAQEAQGFTVEISDALYDDAFEQDFRTMTFVEFRDVYNAVKQIDKLAFLKNKLLKAERDRTFEAFHSEALSSMQEGRKGAVVSPRAKSKTERRFGLINGLFQSTRRLTDIVEELDRFKPFGPMFNGIQRPVNEAQNAQDIMTSEATETLRKLYEVYTDEERSQFKKRVNIQGATRVFQLSHEDRLCIALNWGNADNRKKLVDGYNGFTESDVEKILETLTEKDVKFVQSVWDFIDSFWPAIKAKQERVYGIAPEKVEPTPWVTKFGVMPGGYYPLKYTGAKAESESAADVAKQMMRGAVGFATTAKGHTQARVEGVERPVKIGFDVLHNHVAMVIHDLTHHEMLIDVNRILNDAEISGTIAGFYSEEMLTELRDVVMDIASGGLEKKSPWEAVATWLRTRSTVAGMAWNLWTVIQQTYGFTNAIPKLGPKGAKYMARALHAWLGDASDLESRVAAIHEKSTFMRMRSKTLDRDISELRNTVDPSKRTAITDSYFYLIGKGQMLADIPTWLAGYLYAKGELNASEADAIAYGDKLVEDTQGGGHIKAQAKVQRMGGAFFKLWTTFYSYSNALLNQNVQLIKRTEFKDPLSVGRLLVDMSVLNTLPLLISMLLKDLLKGDDGDEDPWYAKLAKEQVNSVFSMFPFVREIPGLLSGRKYEGPAGTRILPEIQKLTQSISKEVQEKGLDPTEWDYDRPLVSSMFRTGGMFFNLPAPALQKTFEGAKALWEGTTTNPGVLIVGPTKEERK